MASLTTQSQGPTSLHRGPRTKGKRKGKRGKLRFDLAFDGSNYSGWQYHPNKTLPAVYTVVAACWNAATGEPGFGPVASARLDVGVSADHQICSVRTQKTWTPEGLQQLLVTMNDTLPTDIQCLRVVPIPVRFHAINAPLWKRYGYTVRACETRTSNTNRCWHRDGPALDPSLVATALSCFLGTHDFRRFTSTDGPWITSHVSVHSTDATTTTPTQQESNMATPQEAQKNKKARSAVRTIHAACVTERADGALHIAFTGDGFLQQMVRRMVGVAVAVGTGELCEEHLLAALGRDEEKWQETHRLLSQPWRKWGAPAVGLTLEEVHVEEYV